MIRSCLVAAVLLACAAQAAHADTNTSSNWAGYAVHRTGLHFSEVSGSWQQPNATCPPGRRSYSAFWVGLGGYSATSPALEQIGTEVDCRADGRVKSTAWFELVPSPSRTIHMKVTPGDRLRATVRAVGRRVTVTLTDFTTGHRFVHSARVGSLDVSSAEWIAEAPSECVNNSDCQTLPLADFGSARFTRAGVRTARGFAGAISSRHWQTSKILLLPSGGRFATLQTGGDASAVPSSLTSGGASFAIKYRSLAIGTSLFERPRLANVRTG